MLPPGTLAVGKGPVGIHGPTAVGVYVDVCEPCYQRASQEPSMMKSEGHAGQALPSAGHGEDGPAPHWILQLAPTLTDLLHPNPQQQMATPPLRGELVLVAWCRRDDCPSLGHSFLHTTQQVIK